MHVALPQQWGTLPFLTGYVGCHVTGFVPLAARRAQREFIMRLGKYILTAAAATMAVAPAMAANPAANLSVSKSVRTGSVSAKKNELAGGGIIVAILAAAAVVAGIVIVADNDDNSDSN
ncbi:hypothetical protein [Sphingomonas sp. Leaf34]|uniref:hypothetical protein n=1 Tax=Sphingomonas sp. Leaf34 TaxID=1736216 RepID=UPI003FA76148